MRREELRFKCPVPVEDIQKKKVETDAFDFMIEQALDAGPELEA